jgi:hypothetical protein
MLILLKGSPFGLQEFGFWFTGFPYLVYRKPVLVNRCSAFGLQEHRFGLQDFGVWFTGNPAWFTGIPAITGKNRGNFKSWAGFLSTGTVRLQSSQSPFTICQSSFTKTGGETRQGLLGSWSSLQGRSLTGQLRQWSELSHDLLRLVDR